MFGGFLEENIITQTANQITGIRLQSEMEILALFSQAEVIKPHSHSYWKMSRVGISGKCK